MESFLAMAKKRSHGNVVQRCRREPTQPPPVARSVWLRRCRARHPRSPGERRLLITPRSKLRGELLSYSMITRFVVLDLSRTVTYSSNPFSPRVNNPTPWPTVGQGHDADGHP